MDFKLIMTFVDEEKTTAVVDAARAAGATGATIIKDAQGHGLHRKFSFFGLEFMALRSVILILVEQRRASNVLDAITLAGELDENLDTGIALEIDVNRVVGLREHIKILEQKHPID